MGKQASVSKVKKKTQGASKNKIPTNKIVEERREAFDFGGLPIQDFKKNLGCG